MLFTVPSTRLRGCGAVDGWKLPRSPRVAGNLAAEPCGALAGVDGTPLGAAEPGCDSARDRAKSPTPASRAPSGSAGALAAPPSRTTDGPVATGPDCTVPVEPLDELPPPTCTLPVEPVASFVPPPPTETGAEAPADRPAGPADAAGAAETGPDWIVPAESFASLLPPPTATGTVADALLCPVPADAEGLEPTPLTCAVPVEPA